MPQSAPVCNPVISSSSASRRRAFGTRLMAGHGIDVICVGNLYSTELRVQSFNPLEPSRSPGILFLTRCEPAIFFMPGGCVRPNKNLWSPYFQVRRNPTLPQPWWPLPGRLQKEPGPSPRSSAKTRVVVGWICFLYLTIFFRSKLVNPLNQIVHRSNKRATPGIPKLMPPPLPKQRILDSIHSGSSSPPPSPFARVHPHPPGLPYFFWFYSLMVFWFFRSFCADPLPVLTPPTPGGRIILWSCWWFDRGEIEFKGAHAPFPPLKVQNYGLK